MLQRLLFIITGRGNITATAEFNFYCDPEAAMFVLHNYGGNIKLLDLELCQYYSPSWVSDIGHLRYCNSTLFVVDFEQAPV